MKFDDYLMKELHVSRKKAEEISKVVKKYKSKKKKRKKLNIKVPNYTLGEELFNSISHGLGAIFAIVALIMMVVKAHGVLGEVCVCLYGSTMILLYTISCIYHALSPRIEGKKVLRVIDHCNVFLLVYGTYIPISLLGVGGRVGLILFLAITLITSVGITLTAVKIDKTSVLQVICHLLSGWGSLILFKTLLTSLGTQGMVLLITGGVMYSLGSILYGLGSKKKYMHSVFHIFCILGTVFHFLCIYLTLL